VIIEVASVTGYFSFFPLSLPSACQQVTMQHRSLETSPTRVQSPLSCVTSLDKTRRRSARKYKKYVCFYCSEVHRRTGHEGGVEV
jgi:hypothetical protein